MQKALAENFKSILLRTGQVLNTNLTVEKILNSVNVFFLGADLSIKKSSARLVVKEKKTRMKFQSSEFLADFPKAMTCRLWYLRHFNVS